MALRQLVLSNKLAKLNLRKKGLLDKKAEQEKRKASLTEKGEQVRTALEEMTKRADPPTEEEQTAVDEELAQVEADVAALEAEQSQTDADMAQLEAEIKEVQNELDKIQKPVEEVEEEVTETTEGGEIAASNERSMIVMHNKRSVFHGLTNEQRTAIIKNPGVQTLLSKIRAAIKDKRTITNVGLSIPEVVLPLIEQVVAAESQLLPYVNKVELSGTGRQTIMGDIPEAVWTEMCAVLNELALGFSMVEVDGFKVAGYVPVCNAVLQDNDVQLATKVFDAIGKAIAYAMDKAIVFGTGTKMPLGIFTRLAQTDAPDDLPATTRHWVDLHTRNIKTIASSKSGVALYQDLLKHSALTSNKYARGEKVWIMNDTTRTSLMAEMLNFNAAGAVVTAVENVMPIIGGKIVVLEFMPDNMIVGGYGRSYMLAERAGMQFAMSDEYRFVQDQTVFKGTARYDGKPVFPESFVAIGLGTAPSATSITFAPDTANNA